MAVQMSSPALRAENVATPSANACNRPKAAQVKTSANCNNRTKQTDLRNKNGRRSPSTNNLAPDGDLGWMVQRRIPMHNNGIVHREWPRMQHNIVAPRMQPACNTMRWRLKPNLRPSLKLFFVSTNSSRERMQLSKQIRHTNTGDWTPSDMKFIQ